MYHLLKQQQMMELDFIKKNEINKIGVLIKSYLELENIKHEDLSDIDIDRRADYIIEYILKI